MAKYTSLVWFRQDLRLHDNPALFTASEKGRVLALYILDDPDTEWSPGAANRVWLHHALSDLNTSLDGNLLCMQGDASQLIPALVKQYSIDGVFWNRCYEPGRIQRDTAIKQQLREQGTEVKSFNGSLLWEPWDILKKDNTPYKVFTPFYRRGCLNAVMPRSPVTAPDSLQLITPEKNTTVDALALLPAIRWDPSVLEHWEVGEQAASGCLETFLQQGLPDYNEGRDFPAKQSVSRLSPYLHFGQISPHQVWHQAQMVGNDSQLEAQLDHFQSELGWREFSYYLLYHFPSLPEKNFQPKFDQFPWQQNDEALKRWQQGKTGYPLIDAGMRELWQTGYMHNRVRMVVASFLVKNLMIDWREGAKWFRDCLFDADLANNSASWQWVAGSGADAVPYFRIFNPVTQSKKFDPDGEYIKQFVPELKNCPIRYIHEPWGNKDNCNAGEDLSVSEYPHRILDLKLSRDKSLAAFKSIS